MAGFRVLVAPDKFKGSLSAAEVAGHVAAGLRSVAPGLDVVRIPVADGGDGTLDAALAAGFDRVPVRVGGPTGQPVEAALADLERVDLDSLDRRLAQVRVILASDVDNPLLGEAGAAAVYGPQKGATERDVAVLDAALAHWASLVDPAAAARPGAGAAGGVGYAALALLRAQRRAGIDVVLDLVGFHEQLARADLVITGEGSLDGQTLRGKAPAGVAAAALAARVPVVAVCGQRALDDAQLSGLGIAQAYALTDIEPDVQRCQREAGRLLEELGSRIAAQRFAGG
ncbi:MAG: glycerate kinase [Actinobacteria bacterium]|nr:glycerate kinase [Actinomycetota bacterium]